MIASPDLSDSRSRLADWLELRALFSPHGAGEADLASVSRLTSDDHRDREIDETGDIIDEEILDRELEETMGRAAEEIGQRAIGLGSDFPFVVTNRPFHCIVKPLEGLTPSQWTYLFLLLLSGERDKALPKSERIAELIRTGRTLFHACASIGVAGLLRNANTIWFGWPRPSGEAFLKALAVVCDQIGCGIAKTQIPAGLPSSPKDDNIDVVGWRAFRDRRNGNLLILCQAATGEGWDDKSIVNHIDAFRQWFETEPYSRATASIAIPFPAHHEVSEHPAEGFQVARHNALHRSQARHGVLIDRLRIVEAVSDVSADANSAGKVAGLEELPAVKNWVNDVLNAVKQAA